MTTQACLAAYPHALTLPERLHRVYHRLALLPSLEPSHEVNGLFSELVALVQTAPAALAQHVLGDPVVGAVQERLQALCSDGEACLEKHWARRVLQSDSVHAWEALREFPYFENYERLTRLELSALQAATDGSSSTRRMLFIGSGPLPLTSLLLATSHGHHVANLDIDAEASELGQRIATHLGATGRMSFVTSDILEYGSLEKIDVVFLAALVGCHRTEKRAILRYIAERLPQHARVVVRSAHRLRTLLYPDVELDDLGGLVPLLELHPHDDIINSVIVARPSVG